MVSCVCREKGDAGNDQSPTVYLQKTVRLKYEKENRNVFTDCSTDFYQSMIDASWDADADNDKIIKSMYDDLKEWISGSNNLIRGQ